MIPEITATFATVPGGPNGADSTIGTREEPVPAGVTRRGRIRRTPTNSRRRRQAPRAQGSATPPGRGSGANARPRAATRAGATASTRAFCARAEHGLPTSLSRRLTRRSWPPSPRPSSHAGRTPSCSAPSATAAHTSGPTANSLKMPRASQQKRGYSANEMRRSTPQRPQEQPGGRRGKCPNTNADGPGREGGAGPPVGGSAGELGPELTQIFYANQSPLSSGSAVCANPTNR